MILLEKGISQGLVKLDEDKQKITYVYLKKTQNFKDPEEPVRADVYLDLILNYGYKKENIDIEVRVQQGSLGKTSADVVIYDTSGKAFAVIEAKEQNTKDTLEKIRRQARSYANSDELKTSLYYAYRIGGFPLKVFTKADDREFAKLPYNYNEETIFAYIVEGKAVPPPPPNYQPLKSSTPFELKRDFGLCHDIIWNGGEKNAQDAFDEFTKLLFLKMADELDNEEQHCKPYLFQSSYKETPEELYRRINNEYERIRKERKVERELTPLNINRYQLEAIVRKLEATSLIGTDNDPKGLAFETFTEHYMKGEFGQFFTPRNIVEFMIEVSPINWSEKFKKTSKVLDPCCGSGSFLVHAINAFKKRYNKKTYWRDFANNSVFGIELNDKIAVTAKVNIALHDDGHDNVHNFNGLNAGKVLEKGGFDLILTNPPFGSNVPNKKMVTI